jgi:hypothetical protein
LIVFTIHGHMLGLPHDVDHPVFEPQTAEAHRLAELFLGQ